MLRIGYGSMLWATTFYTQQPEMIRDGKFLDIQDNKRQEWVAGGCVNRVMDKYAHRSSWNHLVFEFIIELLWKFFFLYWLFLWSNQVTILHMPWQLSCHGMCKIQPDLDFIFMQEQHIIHGLDYHSWAQKLFVELVSGHWSLIHIVCLYIYKELLLFSGNIWVSTLKNAVIKF